MFLLHSAITGKNRSGLGERFGFIKNQVAAGKRKKYRIWLHAASVGEVQVARALIIELKKILPEADVVLSTVTEQGKAVAQKQLDQDVACIFAPFDLPFSVSRALNIIKPTVYVCLETELWPTMLVYARRSGCRLLLVNGRISEKSYKNYLRFKGLAREILPLFSQISTIQAVDAERFSSLGAHPEQIVVSGNAKYDLSGAALEKIAVDDYRKLLNLRPGQTVLVAGSTHTGEEELLVGVYLRLKKEVPDLIMIAAPRHLERLPEIEAFLVREKVAFERLSAIKLQQRSEDVVLVDTMGDLAGLYSQATFVFCGGSLVPRGGHNIMESAAWGKPVFYGPCMKDFIDAKELLESKSAGCTVYSADELYDRLFNLIKDPIAYQHMVAQSKMVALAHRGSAARQAQLIKDVLLSCPTSAKAAFRSQ